MKNTGHHLGFIILTAASLAICRADPNEFENLLVPQESATAERHAHWRKALRAEFKYAPTTQSDPPGPPDAIPEMQVGPDVIVLPKFVVRDTAPVYRELEKAIRSQTEVTENVIVKRLGIGTHEVKLRHFSMGCYTILFIPVAGGIGWRW